MMSELGSQSLGSTDSLRVIGSCHALAIRPRPAFVLRRCEFYVLHRALRHPNQPTAAARVPALRNGDALSLLAALPPAGEHSLGAFAGGKPDRAVVDGSLWEPDIRRRLRFLGGVRPGSIPGFLVCGANLRGTRATRRRIAGRSSLLLESVVRRRALGASQCDRAGDRGGDPSRARCAALSSVGCLRAARSHRLEGAAAHWPGWRRPFWCGCCPRRPPPAVRSHSSTQRSTTCP